MELLVSLLTYPPELCRQLGHSCGHAHAAMHGQPRFPAYLEIRPDAACLLANTDDRPACILLDDLHQLGLLGLLRGLSAPEGSLQDVILDSDIHSLGVGNPCEAP